MNMILNTMHKKRLHIIRIFTLLLLLVAGGTANEAWAAKVTYHILSLPINTKQLDGTDHQDGSLVDFRTNVRVEVLRVVSSDLHVSLPFEYKSPLATNYRYYQESSIDKTGPFPLYGYNNTTYYFYNIKDNTGTNTTNNANYGDGEDGDDNTPTAAAVDADVRYTPGAACDDNIHIYVTYDVKASPDIDLSTTLDTSTGLLSGGKEYNIHLNDRMVVLNQNRQNRPGAVLDGYYTSEQLASNDFSWIVKEGLNNTAGWRFFGFKFGGNDPYNVTIYTSYDKSTTFRGTSQTNFSTNDVKDREKYIQKDVFKEYRGASFFRLMTAEMNDKNMWLASDADIQWQDGGSRDAAVRKVVPGYYKGPDDKYPGSNGKLCEMSPIFNSFAILNHKSGTGYAFAGSKMNTGTDNWQPKASNGQIQFMDYGASGNNITIVYKAEASVMKVDVYEVKKYIFRVKTPFGSNVDAEIEWSDYAKDDAISTSMIPDELKRKYVNFTGVFKADTNSDGTPDAAVTTFENAQANCSQEDGKYVIYVEYEVVGAPFTAIPAADKITGYATATWYEITDKDSSGKKIKWDATNSVYKNNGGASEYNKESEFAFIGDPFELRIINRKLTVDAGANRYVGCSGRNTGDNLTNNASDEGAGFKWEIPDDEILGNFTLREFGSTNAYWQWTTTGSGNEIKYSTSTSTRMKVMEIGKVNYTFKVVDLAGNIAIQATETLTPFTTLTDYANIPSTIRSPFLADETVRFYSTYSGGGRENLLLGNLITELPATASDIYVAYTTEHLSEKNIQLIYSQQFNVKLNGEFIYWDSSTGKILSNADPGINPDTEKSYLEDSQYLWHLRGRDPYSMRIDNVGASVGHTDPITITVYNTSGDGTSTTESVSNGMFVRVNGDWGNNVELTWTDNRDQASRFIAMMSNNVGVYEVLAATGTSVYYHIGRASTAGAETKIYSIDTEDGGYAHGADQLRFELAGTQVVSYHLIDISKNELFTGEIESKNPRMTLPEEYRSPLVEEYYYYPTRAKALTNLPDDRISEISQDKQEDDTGSPDYVIYVTYKTREDFGFGNSYPRLLKFFNGSSYKLEDGADKLTTSPIQAMYPYCNGDGNLNIYGQEMRDEQMGGGSSTRPRWVWYFESTNSDPYHVKIHSKSTISFGGTHTTYLHTSAVHFKQDDDTAPNLQHVVTGANFRGISGVTDTEYMVLGTTGRYKLVTTDKIAADLDGDGNTTGAGENERRTITSFEQYWKTYNMIKQHVLDIDCKEDPTYKDEFSTVRSTFVIPDELRATLKTKLDELGIGGDNWHSYNAIANALRWNGFNNEGKANTKTVENLEHWYQTFDMGDGTFDIEDADIPPVLVLLDRHGWEIMRKPLPTSSSDPQRDEKLAALKAFDSPMVKEYLFWAKSTKATGCHKYHSLGNAITESASSSTQFKSTSLATLPPLTAKNAKGKDGSINDHFVTYTVKEEYEESYDYSLEYTVTKDAKNKVTGYTITSETGTPSTFIVLQNHQYASDDDSGTSVDVNTAPSNLSNEIIADAPKAEGSKTFKQECLWYVQPNLEIDDEMGIVWSNTVGNSNEPYNKEESKVKYYENNKTDFDPYNIQLKNVKTNKFYTIGMKDSKLEGGAYTGDYTGGGSTSVTLAAQNSNPSANTSESYDHTHLKMTNQTFMAVQDENGNMQLMPRFDHTTRINAFTALAAPLTNATKADVDDASPGAQTTFLVRPQVFDYKVIDNQGNVALRYQTGGEFYPSMPEHFKSPLATEFKFYKTLNDSNSDGVYELGSLAGEIISSFAAAGIQTSADIFIRYNYDESYDTDHENILQGRWMTIKLGAKDVQAQGAVVAANDDTSGTGVLLYTGSKPAMDNADAKRWQWKFLQSPSVSTSNQYKAPDPYAVEIFNREANKDANPTVNPNKMGTPIKVSGKDRFVILAHPDGDYALCAAGSDLTYSFLNGASMTAHDAGSPVAASVQPDASFITSSTYDIADGERLQFVNEVPITFTYKVITNDKLLAASQTQNESTAQSRNFEPFLPEDIQTPLLSQDDYLYYGSASVSDNIYTVIEATQLNTLYGLYDDVVYVRYNPYNELNSPYKVPNVKGSDGGHVARGSGSNDTSLGLNANLLYNIIWYNDEMMKNNDGGTEVQSETGQALQSTAKFEWQLEGNDPYAIKIKSIGATSGETKKYIAEATSTTTGLSPTPTAFMILNRDGYDYGVLVKTGTPVVGRDASMLSGHGDVLTTSDPTHFIIFALATYKAIYRLMIGNTGSKITIPYRGPETDDFLNNDYEIADGTTQRDLSSGTPAGSTYQLGTNVYSFLDGATAVGDLLNCVDAGCISLGAKLEVPEQLYRPNVNYKYFIGGVYNSDGTSADGDMNDRYKGTERTTMGEDAGLLGKTVLINIVYTFNGDLGTNAGSGFVTSVADNLWYTFETSGATPRLAEYTGSLQTKSGYATHYTNDYLWTPLGDPYGFKMYNRYMHKNLGNTNHVMTTSEFNEGTDIVMSAYNADKSVYELLADESTTPGYFLVHPVVNKDGTQYYMRDNNGEIELSTTRTEWTFGLSEDVMRPYFEATGNVGGLNAAGKAAYEAADALTDSFEKLVTLQNVVYNHDKADNDADNYIVHYTPGYYRLYNQPGSEGLSTPRYASGYLHETEKTAVSGGIPMHFYSRVGVSTTFEGDGGLISGFTETPATRGPISVPATEYDPSTIFCFTGSSGSINISTQGLNVLGNKMTIEDETDFTITDIGGGVVALNNSTDYLSYKQTGNIYDLKYGNYADESARWCMEPADKQGLMVTTNSGGDGYYYTTFYAPFDVAISDDDAAAYICTEWNTQVIHPKKVPASSPYAEGKFVPAETPVIIRTEDIAGKIKLSLPSSEPTTPSLSCVFKGECLEQLLSTAIDEDDMVYSFGLPISGYGMYTGADDPGTKLNGDITNYVERDQADTGVGFYINANPNKELSEETGQWIPNNRYVLHNKIYYRADPAPSRESSMRGIEFVPVIFDDDLEGGEQPGEEEQNPSEGVAFQGDGCIYDMMGRKVATRQQVEDGSWRLLRPGIYILNGKKFRH